MQGPQGPFLQLLQVQVEYREKYEFFLGTLSCKLGLGMSCEHAALRMVGGSLSRLLVVDWRRHRPVNSEPSAHSCSCQLSPCALGMSA